MSVQIQGLNTNKTAIKTRNILDNGIIHLEIPIDETTGCLITWNKLGEQGYLNIKDFSSGKLSNYIGMEILKNKPSLTRIIRIF